MAASILVTSIPPSMSRLDAQGCEIGSKYQAACVNSWFDAGFQPISVNAAAELAESFSGSTATQVRTVPTPKDAREITGRRHVFFSDLLNAAVTASRGKPFVLTNADIMLAPTDDLVTRVSRLVPGEVLFSRRIDIDRPERRTGTPYRFGYDLFAAHPDDVSKLTDGGFVFGAPWWDHYFPLAMVAQGCRIQQMTEPIAFHLKHEERWSWPVWMTLGQIFVTRIEKYSLPDAYGSHLARALHPPRGGRLSELKRIIRGKRFQTADQELCAKLHRVSNANLAFVDEVSLVNEYRPDG